MILENKINFKNCKEFLKNKLNEKQLKAIEPIINKLKIFSFYSNNSNINNIFSHNENKNNDKTKTICIEYYLPNLNNNSIAIIENSDNINEDIYGKQAKFIKKDIEYNSLLSMFSCNIESKNGNYDLLFYKNDFDNLDNFLKLKVKAIYLPSNFDESDIKLIKCILENNDIKLYKIIEDNYLLI